VLFHVKGLTGGQIHMPKLRVVFRNFANAPKTVPVTMRKAKKNQSGETPRDYQMLERCDLVQTRSCEKFTYPVTADSFSIQQDYCFYADIFVSILEQSGYWTLWNAAVIQEYTRISLGTAYILETHFRKEK